MAPTVKKTSLFFYLLILTGFFLLFEISFFIQCNKAYLADFTLVTDTLHVPKAILPGIFYFLLAQLFVHVSYCALIWAITLVIVWHSKNHKQHSTFITTLNKYSLSQWDPVTLGFILWILGILTILVANQYFFPNSKFADLTATLLFNRLLVKSILLMTLICWLCVIILILLGLIRVVLYVKQNNIRYRLLLNLLSVMVIGSAYFLYPHSPTLIQDAATSERPNIIIIGIDSLRPDFLSYFGHQKRTPFFDVFLNQSTVFAEAITPLARTFPAWTSLLSGQYPREIGVRSDLAKQDKVPVQSTLSRILQQQGYKTVYATDETRFSNIDTNYGFDRIMTPPTGLNDFLLGTFNDFPLSNLLVNSRLGKWLFPYSYANRPAFFTYDPNSFLNLLRPILMQARDQPLFLATHFCLPHTPYLWGDFYAQNLNAIERYEATIIRMDEQLRDFFALLQEAQLLKHAVVVMFSDHGEALELPGDRITEAELFFDKTKPIPKFYPPMLNNEHINQSAGHGTDVLGLPQYHILLAFKLYGVGQQSVQTLPGIVSLLDIKPTILDFLRVSAHPTSGTSLADIIRGKQKHVTPKHYFLESDFSPEAVRTVYPETRKVLLEGIQLFQVDPVSTRLLVKDSMSKMIIDSKQFAIIDDHWMLALYPQNKHSSIPILINLNTGEWTNDLQSLFAQQAPLNSMLEKLKNFYGNEMKQILSTSHH